MTRLALRVSLLAVAALAALAGACSRSEEAGRAAGPPIVTARSAPADTARPSGGVDAASRDLSVDETMGGHTLARHVGRTDEDLADRLRREAHISAASTYTDRATAERVVGAALAAGGRRLEAWQNRQGHRPNLVLRYSGQSGSIGRSLRRGDRVTVTCTRVLVVLRWDEQASRFYVLTSYPETE